MYRFLPALLSLPNLVLVSACFLLSTYPYGHTYSQGLQSPNQVGNTPVQFDVTYGGAASYKVPLNMPTGAAGLQPQISLNYNSQFGNGVMGLGWQLATGLARIEECYKRNTNQRITCLNGEELVSIGNGYYRTEIDSGILVETVSASQLTLHYENGTVKTLKRQLSSPNVYVESKHTQRGGASYAVNWSVNSTHREVLVHSITYQGNAIEFQYEARNDVRKAYWLGAPRNRTKRLDKVVATVDDQQYREYDVIYDYDSVSGFSKVSHIQECDANGDCLQPLSFTWSDSGAKGLARNDSINTPTGRLVDLNNDGKTDVFDKNLTSSGGSGTPGYWNYHGDIDGDGRDDLITVEHTGALSYKNNDPYVKYTIHYKLASGATKQLYKSTNSVKYSNADYSLDLIDVNGDGREDIVRRGPNGHTRYWSLSETAALSQVAIPTIRTPNTSGFGGDGLCHEVSLVDVNGDGLLDAVNARTVSSSDKEQACYSRNGDSHRTFLNLGNHQFSKTSIAGLAKTVAQVDMNGDGLVDLIGGNAFDYTGGIVASYGATLTVSYSKGNGKVATTSVTNTQLAQDKSPYKSYLDLNGDGLKEIVACDSQCSVYYQKPHGGFAPPQTLTIAGINPKHFAYRADNTGDLNGDAQEDFIFGDKVISFRAKRPYIHTFTDSHGNQHQVTYARLTDNEVYTRDCYPGQGNCDDIPALNAAEQFYQQPLTVVKTLITPDHEVHYKYAGARMHNGEHGYLGFKSISSILSKTDQNGADQSLVTTSYIRQDHPFVGKLESVRKKVYDGDAASVFDQIEYRYHDKAAHLVAVNKTENKPVGCSPGASCRATGTDFSGQMNSYFDWQSFSLNGGVHKLYLKEKTVDHLQLSDDTIIKTEHTQHQWTQHSSGRYGRLIATIQTTKDKYGQTRQQHTTTLNYLNGDSHGKPQSFLVDRSTVVTQRFGSDAGGATIHTVKTEYSHYSNGLVQYQWLNKSHSKGTRTYYQYDSHGNNTLTTVSAASGETAHSQAPRTTERRYSHQGKYLASDTNSAGHRTHYQDYSVHGLPGRIIDPKGAETLQVYDGLGRIIRTTDHLGNDHYTTRGYCNGSSASCSNDAHSWERIQPAGGAEVYTYWDAQGRKVKTAAQSLQGGQWLVQAWEYDRYGRQIKASVPRLQSLSSAVSLVASNDNALTETTYDALNRVVRRQLPGVDRVVHKDYRNELGVKTLDPEGRLTITETNVLDQVIRTQQADNTDVRFRYDAQGNITHQRYPILDGNGNAQANQYHQIINSYDIFGNQTAINDPNRGHWHYTYNAFGELIRQQDARNQNTYFTYDALGRMLTQRDSETYAVWHYDQAYQGLLDQVQQYDISSLSNSAKAALTPASVASSGATLSYQQTIDYDPYTRQPETITTQQRNRTNQLVTSTRSLSYDGFARLRYETLPAAYQNQGSLSAPRLVYDYSSSGYLTHIRDRDSNYVYQEIQAIDAFGNITTEALGNNLELYRWFNATTGWAEDMQANNANGLVIDQSYSHYNKLGHIGQRQDATYYNGGADTQTWTDVFNYNDGLQQQLTDVATTYQQSISGIDLSIDWQHHYDYDDLGNLRHRGLNFSTLPDGANRTHTETVAEQLAGLFPNYNFNVPGQLPATALPSTLTVGNERYTLNTDLQRSTNPGTTRHDLQTALLSTDPLSPGQNYPLQSQHLNGPSQQPQNPADNGWIRCANERHRCTLPATATVRYGANGTYVTRTNVNGSILCANSQFGDPTPGTYKTCDYQLTNPSPGPWINCAQERQRCNVPGPATVRYGANNIYFIQNNVSDSILCANSQFGDPTPGIVKACQYQLKTDTTPYYIIPANATWASVAETLYRNGTLATALRQAMGNPPLVQGERLSGLPASLQADPEPESPYYLIPQGASWASLGQTLYGSPTVADELQTAMNNQALTAGTPLRALPATLVDDDTSVSTEPYYATEAGTHWNNLAQDLYGTSNASVSRLSYSTTEENLIYNYGNNSKPHQLSSLRGTATRNYQYDNNGNITADGDKAFSYNAHNKLRQVNKGSHNTRFHYNPDRSRTLRVDTHTSTTTETLYVDNYERVTTSGSTNTVEHKYHIAGIALIIQTESSNTETQHALIHDYQGSLIAITNHNGNLQQRFRYSPYGEQNDVSQGIMGVNSLTTRGYTAHEHIEGMDLIHMGGRIYDPIIGRMLQTDIIIQAPALILSYNRYAYVWNDPMNGTDPSGYERIGDEGDDRTFDQAQADYENTYGGSYDYSYHSGEFQAYDQHVNGPNSEIGKNYPGQVLPHEVEDIPSLYGTRFTSKAPAGGFTVGDIGLLAFDALNSLPPHMGGVVTKGPGFAAGLWNSFKGTLGRLANALGFGSKSSNGINISTKGRTLEEIAAIREYVQRVNSWLAKNGSQTIRSTAGNLRRDANAAARAERLRAARTGKPYKGQAGHVPDTAVTGEATPPGGWLDMPGCSNSACGGVLGPRVGQTITHFTVDGVKL